MKYHLTTWAFRFLALFLFVTLLNFWIEWECYKFGEITGIETKREPFTDCYLSIDGEWVSYLTYQLRQIK